MMGRLDQIRHDTGFEMNGFDINEFLESKDIPLVHEDARRRIFDPSLNERYAEFSKKILNGLEGVWYSHNIIEISQSGIRLGDHHHDYRELFFTPRGEIKFRLVDGVNLETRDYELESGSRLLIPKGIDHSSVGKQGSILMGYGDAEFNRDRLIPCARDVKGILDTLSLI